MVRIGYSVATHCLAANLAHVSHIETQMIRSSRAAAAPKGNGLGISPQTLVPQDGPPAAIP